MTDTTTPEPTIEPAAERTCRVCGCTDTRACNPPCSWEEPIDEGGEQGDICSTCARAMLSDAEGVRFLTAKAENVDGALILRNLLMEGTAAGVVPPISFSVSLGVDGRVLVLDVDVAGMKRTETVDLQPLVTQWVSAVSEELRAQYLSKLVRP
jgi:hypothetical protein